MLFVLYTVMRSRYIWLWSITNLINYRIFTKPLRCFTPMNPSNAVAFSYNFEMPHFQQFGYCSYIFYGSLFSDNCTTVIFLYIEARFRLLQKETVPGMFHPWVLWSIVLEENFCAASHSLEKRIVTIYPSFGSCITRLCTILLSLGVNFEPPLDSFFYLLWHWHSGLLHLLPSLLTDSFLGYCEYLHRFKWTSVVISLSISCAVAIVSNYL